MRKNKIDNSLDGDALSEGPSPPDESNEYGAMEKRVSCFPAGLVFNPLCTQMSGLSDDNCRLLSVCSFLFISLVRIRFTVNRRREQQKFFKLCPGCVFVQHRDSSDIRRELIYDQPGVNSTDISTTIKTFAVTTETVFKGCLRIKCDAF